MRSHLNRGIAPQILEGYGLSKKDKPNYFDPRMWKQQKLEAMTNAAIRRKNAEFAAAHQADTDAQLIAYLRECAQELGHTPYPAEVFGGAMIAGRFGGWSKAIGAAGLPYPMHHISDKGRRIYRKTMKEQARVFDQRQAEKREAIRSANLEKAAAAQAEKQARLERDARWGETHGDMADDELLAYLCKCAEELGHVPYSYEVEGGKYISQRLGGWGMAIYRAGLPELKGVKGPTAAQKAALRAR